MKSAKFSRLLEVFLSGIKWGAILILALKFLNKSVMTLGITLYVSTAAKWFFWALFYVFLSCSLILVVIVYWVGWEYVRYKIQTTFYRSKLVAKDYYKQDKKVDFETFVSGAVAEQGQQKLEIDNDLTSGRNNTPDMKDPGVSVVGDQVEADIVTGVYRELYKNGQLKLERSYKDGKLDGFFRTYYEDGRLHQEKNFVNGELNGPYMAYDEDGSIFFEINYKDNVQHGKDIAYFKNGNIQYEDTYIQGKRVNRKTYSESGELKFDQDFM
ncbi:MAG: hypothetical protein KAR05_08500 [Candidatus Omnitrophica bacterium]|nr:hypothetical protein [Candidatus Omnitrophota bacterium]